MARCQNLILPGKNTSVEIRLGAHKNISSQYFTLLTTRTATLCPVLRISLLILFGAAILGVFVSLLPNPPRAVLGEVSLFDVDLELHPQADPDALWFFRAKRVNYDSATRESVVTGSSVGERRLRGALDLTLDAKDIVIDSSDNLRLERADIHIIKGCWFISLESRQGQNVFVDQTFGYRAPFARVKGPNVRSEGGPIEASFDFESRNVFQNPVDQFRQAPDGSREECGSKGQILNEQTFPIAVGQR